MKYSDLVKTKMHNTPTIKDGVKFPSKLEARYNDVLVYQLKQGLIAGYCRQAIFDLSPGVTYRTDFIVFKLDGTYEVIETKGRWTEGAKIKYRLYKEKFTKVNHVIESKGDF